MDTLGETKQTYAAPCILLELELEARAGSALGEASDEIEIAE